MLAILQTGAYHRGMGETVGARIRRLRKERGLPLKAVLPPHRSVSWLSRVERGEIDDVGTGDLTFIAGRLGVPPSDLLGDTTPPTVRETSPPYTVDEETARLTEIGRQVVELVQGEATNIRVIRPNRGPRVAIPIVNSIAADRAQSESSQLEDRLFVPEELLRGAKKPVAFRVAGDCLALRGIVTGDHLIVDTANTAPRNGQIVAARLNGEDTAKIYCRIDARTVELQPSLPEYPTLRAVEGTDELTIIGTFVAVWATGRRD